MSSKTLLFAVMAELFVISLLCDVIPASSAAVASTSAARHRRQLAESVDHPTVEDTWQNGRSGSALVRSWLRAAAARAAADRQRSYDEEDTDGAEQWKRLLHNGDIYYVRRRSAWNNDHYVDLIRRNSVSSSHNAAT